MHLRRAALAAPLLALLLLPSSSGAQDKLKAGFQNPPASARPHTWWHWINGNGSKEGITADLEAMKRAGIGGVQIFNVDNGIPDGDAPFMGEKWKGLIAHAVKEAGRLGIEVCVHNGAGWSSSGGPWVTPDNAMKRTVWTETAVHGPGAISQALPQPESVRGYYRDIAVFAVRTPANETGDQKLRIGNLGPKIGLDRGRIAPEIAPTPAGMATPKDGVFNITARMSTDGKLTWDAPAGDWTVIRFGYTLTGAQCAPAPAAGRGLECDKLSKAALDAFFGGMMKTVMDLSGPLKGKVLNNALVDSYETGFQNWTPGFQDEFKRRCGYDMMPYLPVIAGRVVGTVEESERFLWDYRRVIADMWCENYYAYFTELCHKNGLLASTEPYGNGTFDNLRAGGVTDIPMGEFWIGGWTLETAKLAASSSHTYGRKYTGAESFTADDNHAKWAYDPYSIKALGDLSWTLGINRYIYHRYAMQPWVNLKPGMTMGPWGTNFDRTNTWWEQFIAFNRYVARSQYLLQSGKFVADLCVFVGDEGPNDLPGRGGINPAIPAGYDYDGCDRQIILQRMSVKDGRIVLPDGMSYRALVLPENRFMTLPTLTKIGQLVKAGAVVIGPKPDMTPSLSGYPASDAAVRKLAGEIWGDIDGKTVTSHAYGEGKVYFGLPVEDVLQQLGVQPDFEPAAETSAKLVYIHRSIDGAEVYFVSNQQYRTVTADATFRAAGVPELWHSDTGVIESAPVYRTEDGRTTVNLRFDPAGSVFVVFRKSAAPSAHLASFARTAEVDGVPQAGPKVEIKLARYEANDGSKGADVTATVARMVAEGTYEIPATNAVFGDPANMIVKRLRVEYTVNGKPMSQTVTENETMALVQGSTMAAPAVFDLVKGAKGLELIPWLAGTYTAAGADGKPIKLEVKQNAAIVTAMGPWKLAFPAGLGAPAQVDLPQLISWPEHSDPGVQHFSGTATYTTTLDVPASMLLPGRAVVLDLGRVKNIAEVALNGKPLGILWKAPFAVDVTGIARAGTNSLTVKVTNLWVNRLIGDSALPADAEYHGGGNIAKWPEWLLKGEPRPQTGRVGFATWQFYKPTDPLIESGLIGPVVIRSAQKVAVK